MSLRWLLSLGRFVLSVRRTSIEVYEWTRGDVLAKRLPNNPQWADLATPRGVLPFSGWNFAHAVVKSDFLRHRSLLFPALGFLLQMDEILESSGGNLRVVPGAATLLNDLTHNSVVGRMGHGLSLLFADAKGFAFAGHLSSDPMVRAIRKKDEKAADFLFEDRSGTRMVLEAKSTFGLAVNQPSAVKGVLKKALVNQVDPWITRVVPPAGKGYVTYACIRESSNAVGSALVYVDPDSSKPETIALPPNWVRLQNYGAWLRVMGMRSAAEALRTGSPVTDESTQVYITNIGGIEFAVVPLVPDTMNARLALCAGIDISALMALRSHIGGNPEPLRRYQPLATDQIADRDIAQSVFSDGILFGLVDAKSVMRGEAFAF